MTYTMDKVAAAYGMAFDLMDKEGAPSRMMSWDEKKRLISMGAKKLKSPSTTTSVVQNMAKKLPKLKRAA